MLHFSISPIPHLCACPMTILPDLSSLAIEQVCKDLARVLIRKHNVLVMDSIQNTYHIS
jgi:hypothetical protein